MKTQTEDWLDGDEPLISSSSFKLRGRGKETEGRCPQDKDRALTGAGIQTAHYPVTVLCFPV